MGKSRVFSKQAVSLQATCTGPRGDQGRDGSFLWVRRELERFPL